MFPTATPADTALPFPPAVYPRNAPRHAPMTRREYVAFNRQRAVRCWLGPYLRSRIRPHQFRPLLTYLFTEWKCNLDCHYCWARNNTIKGMTEDVARRSIDWLHETGCRVLAIMGGEPLLRPTFMHRLTDYAVQRGFFVYLPTNGRLMRPEVTDKLGDAGLATVNLAVNVDAREILRPQVRLVALDVDVQARDVDVEEHGVAVRVPDLGQFQHVEGLGEDRGAALRRAATR